MFSIMLSSRIRDPRITVENIESFRDGIAGSNLAIDHLFFSNFRYDPVVLLFFITPIFIMESLCIDLDKLNS